MKGLSAKGREGGLGPLRQKRRLGAQPGPIDRIAKERMADRGQMDPNLVSPAGFQPAGQETGNRTGNRSGDSAWPIGRS